MNAVDQTEYFVEMVVVTSGFAGFLIGALAGIIYAIASRRRQPRVEKYNDCDEWE